MNYSDLPLQILLTTTKQKEKIAEKLSSKLSQKYLDIIVELIETKAQL
jgi:hypothetical protein